MNPENRGEHIQLRHSHLWRKPLQYEKPVADAAYPQKQLNERTLYSIQSVQVVKAGEIETTPFVYVQMVSKTDHLYQEELLQINLINY